jgi:hypothetical protein
MNHDPEREEKFIEAKVRGMTHADAARFAGYAHPEVQGARIYKRVQAEVGRRISEALHGAGGAALSVLVELLNSQDTAAQTRAQIAQTILSFGGHKAADKLEVSRGDIDAVPREQIVAELEKRGLVRSSKGSRTVAQVTHEEEAETITDAHTLTTPPARVRVLN